MSSPSRTWINSDPIFLLTTSLLHVIGRHERSKRCRMVFGALFLFLALAIGIKKLAFVITVSAFLLILLEYVGVCSKFHFIFQSYVLSPSKSVIVFECDRTSDGFSDSTSDDDDHDHSSGYTTNSGEIEMVNQVTMRSVMDEGKMMCGVEDGIFSYEGLGNKKRRSRRAILKAKIIQKLVPKKLRSSKYRKGSQGKNEDCSITVKMKQGDDGVGNLTLPQVICESESKSEECKYFQLPLGCEKVDDGKPSNEEEADGVMFGPGHGFEIVNRFDIPNKSVTSSIQMDTRGKSGYIKLVVIVLAGLIGGRILSFFLAVGYCCILKYTCTLSRKDHAKSIFTFEQK